MAPLSDHVTRALSVGPQAVPLGQDFDDLPDLTKPGYQPLETGYTLNPDGSMFVAGLTRFPRASPAMLDWWFWWFTRETTRYKLWYPEAHLYAETEAEDSPRGTPDRERYVGTVSYIDEYVGSSLGRLRVHWIEPSDLGFDAAALDPEHATAACCRIGLSDAPFDWGYLIHYIRRVDDGTEMRVRVWMGGEYVAVRGDPASLTDEQEQQLGAMRRMEDGNARAMFIHSSREMAHLAGFLPDIYREYQSRGL